MTTNSDEQRQPLDLAAARQQLREKKGKDYWRSLNELANSPEFEKVIEQEYPRQASLLGTLNRRDFLKVLGASLALAGLTACVPQGSDKILPYVKPPEVLLPGKPVLFASTVLQDGYGQGVLITTTMGRPIKVDGNPKHPATLGGSDVFMQALPLELYDPERLKQVMNQKTAKTWGDFTNALGSLSGNWGQGAGLRILSGMTTSPSLIDQMGALLKKYPQAKWVQFSPVARNNSLAGANLVFGQPYEPVYDFSKADVILSLDCDFLFAEPGHVRYGRDFGVRRQPISANGTMNRLYMIEGSSTMTGSNADHRLAVKPSQIEGFARAIAARLGLAVTAPTGDVAGQPWLDALTADLKSAGKGALVLAGERQPAAVHALAYAINQALGAVGNTVNFIAPVAQGYAGDGYTALKTLAQEMSSGAVDTLVILDSNPAYTAPADLDFVKAMGKVKNVITLANAMDETAVLSSWAIPAAHSMESWGDARAFDGTISIIQPTIEPLYGGKSALELIAALLGQPVARGYDLLRTYWQGQLKGGDFALTWRDLLGKGVIADTASAPIASLPTATLNGMGALPAAASGMEIVFEPDYTVWDGRFTNNAWLQELPKPLSKLTWDNAAYLSPATATKLAITDGDMLILHVGERNMQAAASIQPGQPDDVVVLSLGYGRKEGGSVLANSGFNANLIRTSAAPWFQSGLQVTKGREKYTLATTHEHWTMENRDLVRSTDLEDYKAHPNFAHDGEEQAITLYGQEERTGYAWGMSINLNSCIGCNACVIACQSENNIPTVGKDQVIRGREMHWIRIDRYYKGSANRPRFVYQPVPCMHCEKAPCEVVCPVEATSHSAEGINEMTYNRCVGTRYCANNCPYKVRRFNFYKYVDENVASMRALRNPDVTARSRGVMEKCTYCVQRVNEARIQAEAEGRPIADGEVQTACQVACPTQAIVFGNINDANSTVRKLKDLPLNYGLLADLGTQPRTTYVAQVKNPNPMIKEEA